ncbi:hypothetical protein ID128_01020 [Candidatus Wolbachia massiliensis]|uniref:Uncharacterized protein n=1 Tax=Candidatus Wolbachia massiliensis TaxID=1845000 RepID=A0A7M3U244_9RICK|nr:hypothetical protein ID128_01020 [Candidatus Wolbachia massiliensis]
MNKRIRDENRPKTRLKKVEKKASLSVKKKADMKVEKRASLSVKNVASKLVRRREKLKAKQRAKNKLE